ncbi:CAP domain-containing protein [bacterium]|nr:CAP domain-containing protein [bacterium]
MSPQTRKSGPGGACLLVRGLCAALLLLAFMPEPVRAAEVWRESYSRVSEVEKIYGGPQDAITVDQARDLLTRLTNETRKRAGLSQLKWSGPAERLAGEHAQDMALHRYINHYSLDGFKCERRFNMLGHTDNVMENIAYYEINLQVFITPQLVRRVYQHWLDSESHRANILDPAHTHIGCGLSIEEKDGTTYAAAVCEFVADWGEAQELPLSASTGETLELEGRLDVQRARLRYIGLSSEDLPFQRDREYQNTHAGGYSPPAPVLALLPRAGVLAALRSAPKGVKYAGRSVRYDPDTGEYSTLINMPERWPPGAYYVTVWADAPDKPELGTFCVSTQVVLVDEENSTVTTKGMNEAR